MFISTSQEACQCLFGVKLRALGDMEVTVLMCHKRERDHKEMHVCLVSHVLRPQEVAESQAEQGKEEHSGTWWKGSFGNLEKWPGKPSLRWRTWTKLAHLWSLRM